MHKYSTVERKEVTEFPCWEKIREIRILHSPAATQPDRTARCGERISTGEEKENSSSLQTTFLRKHKAISDNSALQYASDTEEFLKA
jgi:hypothetical protein